MIPPASWRCVSGAAGFGWRRRGVRRVKNPRLRFGKPAAT
jgi:hypothetical protein